MVYNYCFYGDNFSSKATVLFVFYFPREAVENSTKLRDVCLENVKIIINCIFCSQDQINNTQGFWG